MAGRIDGRTDWGEGKEEEGGIETWGRRPRGRLSFFSPSLSHPELHVFGGNGSYSGRSPAPTVDHPSDDRDRPPRRPTVLYPSTAAPVQCSAPERRGRDQTMQKGRRRPAGGDCDCVHVAM